jgi:hypothetical protein
MAPDRNDTTKSLKINTHRGVPRKDPEGKTEEIEEMTASG